MTGTGNKICLSFWIFLLDHFADHYKLRGGVYFVDSLPTTASGKLLRRKVKETAIALHQQRMSGVAWVSVEQIHESWISWARNN